MLASHPSAGARMESSACASTVDRCGRGWGMKGFLLQPSAEAKRRLVSVSTDTPLCPTNTHTPSIHPSHTPFSISHTRHARQSLPRGGRPLLLVRPRVRQRPALAPQRARQRNVRNQCVHHPASPHLHAPAHDSLTALRLSTLTFAPDELVQIYLPSIIPGAVAPAPPPPPPPPAPLTDVLTARSTAFFRSHSTFFAGSAIAVTAVGVGYVGLGPGGRRRVWEVVSGAGERSVQACRDVQEVKKAMERPLVRDGTRLEVVGTSHSSQL